MNRRGLILTGLAGAVSACSGIEVQAPLPPEAGLRPARLEADAFVSFDGARLGLTRWLPEGEPWMAVCALHGMNDYANAFHMAAPTWAAAGVAVYAIDQRGFGRSPRRGVWGGEALMVEDARAFIEAVRERHPRAKMAAMGESMGGAVALSLFAQANPPPVDRLVLLAPAVWGWSSQPLPYKTALWVTARVAGSKVIEPPRFVTDRVHPTDNIEELIAMGRDRLIVWGARTDALYGLVDLMQSGWDSVARVQAPLLWLYGANDEVIPENAAFSAARTLRPGQRTAYYPQGYHLLTRDHARAAPIGDVLAFLRDADAPLPSGAEPIPTAPPPPALRSAGL